MHSATKSLRVLQRWSVTRRQGHNDEIAATKEAAAAMANLRQCQMAAGSTFENNKKFEGEDGKFYGWAKKDGKDILVEWGSVATEVIKKVGDAAADAIPEAPKVENAPTGDPKIDALRNGTFFDNRRQQAMR